MCSCVCVCKNVGEAGDMYVYKHLSGARVGCWVFSMLVIAAWENCLRGKSVHSDALFQKLSWESVLSMLWVWCRAEVPAQEHEVEQKLSLLIIGKSERKKKGARAAEIFQRCFRHFSPSSQAPPCGVSPLLITFMLCSSLEGVS